MNWNLDIFNVYIYLALPFGTPKFQICLLVRKTSGLKNSKINV